MRMTLSAIVLAAGLAGFGSVAQAAPVSTAVPAAAAFGAGAELVQLTPGERRMMRRRAVRREVRRMERRQVRRAIRRDVRRSYRGY